jgi:hypothetical protein
MKVQQSNQPQSMLRRNAANARQQKNHQVRRHPAHHMTMAAQAVQAVQVAIMVPLPRPAAIAAHSAAVEAALMAAARMGVGELTKLLYCQECGDIIAPYRKERKVRWCVCGRHAVWWENSWAGILRVHDSWGKDGQPSAAMAYVLGLTNVWLGMPEGTNWAGDTSMNIADEHQSMSQRMTKNLSCSIKITEGSARH